MALTKTGGGPSSSREVAREEFLDGGFENKSTVFSNATLTDDLRALRCFSALMCCFFCSSDSFRASIQGCLRLLERLLDEAV